MWQEGQEGGGMDVEAEAEENESGKMDGCAARTSFCSWTGKVRGLTLVLLSLCVPYPVRAFAALQFTGPGSVPHIVWRAVVAGPQEATPKQAGGVDMTWY